MTMKTSDFYYDLPKELIAQTPVEPRDSSRLLVLDRETGEISHEHFYNIIDHLGEGDLLVANDSRVLPARIYGVKDETGARVEFLLLRQISGNRWETLCKPATRPTSPLSEPPSRRRSTRSTPTQITSRRQFVLLQRKSTRQLPREFFTRTLLQEASLISRSV